MALDAELNLAALGTAQALGDGPLGDFFAHGCGVVDRHDAVTRHESNPGSRTARDDLDDTHGIIHEFKLDTDVAHRAAHALGRCLELLGTHVTRVGVQVAQDFGDAHLDEVLEVGRVHIVLIDEAQDGVDLTVAVNRIAVGRDAVTDKQAHHHRYCDGEG